MNRISRILRRQLSRSLSVAALFLIPTALAVWPNNKYGMIFSLLTFLGVVGFVIFREFLFNKRNILKPEFTRTDASLPRSTRLIDLALRIALALAVAVSAYDYVLPLSSDLYNSISEGSVPHGNYFVTRVYTSAGMRAIPFQKVFLRDTDQSYIFPFSFGRIKEGSTYHLELLPRSGTVLTASRVHLNVIPEIGMPPASR